MPRVKQKKGIHRRVSGATYLIIAAITIIALVVVAAIVFAPSKPQRAIANQVSQTLTKTPAGNISKRIIPDGKLIDTMVVPAGANWWQVLGRYVPDYTLSTLKYDTLDGPTAMALLHVNSKLYSTRFNIGMPVVVLTYKSEAAAIAAQAKISKTADEETNYGPFQLGNNVLLMPRNLYGDQAFIVKAYRISAANIQLNKAYWHISWTNLSAYMKSVQTKDYAARYNLILSQLGVKAVSTDAYWDGYSTDGSHWFGENNTANDTAIFDPTSVNVKKIITTLYNSRTTTPLTADGKTSDYAITNLNQSLVLRHFMVSTPSGSAGNFINAKGVLETPKKTTKNVITIVGEPTTWFQAMTRSTSDIYTLFAYRRLTLTLHTNDNVMNMTFEASIY